MSLGSITLCFYSLFRMQNQNAASDLLAREIRHRLLSNNFQSASELCQSTPNLLSRIVLGALKNRSYGASAMAESMKLEGKRATLSAWQRLGLLQDIAVLAPMLGLLGTVVGLFYAFYDINRSFDSINQMLDGLGVSVGTTIAGIAVAILSMALHSLVKFRLIRSFAKIESEASMLAHLIDTKN
jgi:biopolymer transport protein ExbB